MKMEFGPDIALDPSKPIASQLTRILRERIIRNQLTPGYRISEAEIARHWNVSRQPVREAFIKLAEQGLVAVLPQRGTIVTRIATDDVMNARFMREAVEADIVCLLAAAHDGGLIAELRGQILRQKQVAVSEPARFIQLDERFHRTLADAAGKAGVWTQLEGLKAQMDRVRFLALAHFPIDNLITQHSAIVDRIEAGDVHGSDAAIRGHLREVLNDLPQIADAHPEFFETSGTAPQQSADIMNDNHQGGD